MLNPLVDLDALQRTVLAPKDRSSWVIAVAPMLSKTSAAVVIEAIPPRKNPRPDDPKTDIAPNAARYLYVVRWIRTWAVPRPEPIRKALNTLKNLHPKTSPIVMDVTDAGKVLADSFGLGAILVLESALGARQVDQPSDDGVLRMPQLEGLGALRSLSSDGRLIIADVPLANEMRSRIFKPPEEQGGLERALGLGLWWLIRAGGDPVYRPTKTPDPDAEPELPHRDRRGFPQGFK